MSLLDGVAEFGAHVDRQNGLAFGEPSKPLTEEYKPRTIGQFIGLGKQKTILENLIANPRPCGLRFLGTPGSGKTSMAFAFADAIGAQIHHVPSQDCNLENLERAWIGRTVGNAESVSPNSCEKSRRFALFHAKRTTTARRNVRNDLFWLIVVAAFIASVMVAGALGW